MKVLNIIETAYRATLEEQDDPIVWLLYAMKGAGADVDVLLSANAVNYAVEAQDASGLALASAAQTQPPQLAQDVANLARKGVTVYVVDEALQERGISGEELICGIQTLPRARIAELFAGYDQVWQW